MKRYAGSYVNLNAMGSKKDDDNVFKNKYAGSYLPLDVKNWSNREEVRQNFVNKYASAYTNLNAMESDTTSDDARAQRSDSRSDPSLPSASAPRVSMAASNKPVDAKASTVTASRDSADAQAAIEMASVPDRWALTASHASQFFAVTLFVAGITFLRATRKSHHKTVLQPL